MSHQKKLDNAYQLMSEEDYEGAFSEFIQLASSEVDDSALWINLGWLYQTGSGTNANLEEAIKCYQKAADEGEFLGDYYLATIYKDKQEMEKAICYFSKSADRGHSSSAYWLGTMYLNGEGCSIDTKKAERYLTIAMNNGHIFAKRDLALANIKGTFGKRNICAGISNYIVALIKGTFLAFKDYENHNIR